MRRFLLSAAAVVIGLALVGTAEAGPKGGSGSKGGSSSSHSMHSSYSSHSSHMSYTSKSKVSYFSKDHFHWSHCYWWGKYGCYTYYCPSTYCWYYWYEPECCYYPCSYIPYATPVYQTAPVGVAQGVTQNVNVTNNSPGSATAAAGTMPPAPPR